MCGGGREGGGGGAAKDICCAHVRSLEAGPYAARRQKTGPRGDDSDVGVRVCVCVRVCCFGKWEVAGRVVACVVTMVESVGRRALAIGHFVRRA